MSRPARFALVLAALVLAGLVVALALRSRAAAAPTPAVVPAPLIGIGALGTLEPAGRIRVISAPGPSPRLAEVLVDEGQEVVAGQILARTDEFPVKSAEARSAQAQALVAQAQLEQTRAGAKTGELAAQEAAVAAATTDLAQRQRDLVRADELHRTGVTTEAEVERQRSAVDTGRSRLAEAQARLAALAQVRDVDVRLRERQVEAAEATAAVAEAARERTVITAPIAGRVLRIHARAGELVPGRGILELGDTRHMHAVAEIYEADVPRVRLGMGATVRVKSTDLVCRDGRVVAIGSLVGRKVALDNDPVTDTDARVVEVRIELGAADSAAVAGLSNARVEVVLHEQP